jgi:hypothetical protein
MKIRNATNKAHPATGFYPWSQDRAAIVDARES